MYIKACGRYVWCGKNDYKYQLRYIHIFSILSIVNSLQIGIYIIYLAFLQLRQAQGIKQNNDIWSKAQFYGVTRIHERQNPYIFVLGIIKLNGWPFSTRIDKQKK